MKAKCSIDSFRKNFNKSFPDFYLRIRNDSNDIAYYNGIKAFEVSKLDNDFIKITIPKDVYKLNATNVRNAKRKGINIIDIIDKLKNKYFNELLHTIEIRKGPKSYDKNNHIKTKKAFENIKISLGINIKNIQDELSEQLIMDILKAFDNENITSYKIKINSFSEDLLVESIFIENCKEKYGLAKPIFHYEKLKNDKVINLQDLYKDTKNAIQKYEECTDIKLEKKYQHQFILNTSNYYLKNIYPFEEEYTIKEKKTINDNSDKNTYQEKNGRIDAILYKRNHEVLEDIYLIELKVDEKVIAKDNGVLTHLDDIKNLINKTDFDNVQETNFFYILKDRIEQRIKALEDKNFSFNNSKNKIDYKIHFFTIIGFTDRVEISKKEVIRLFNAFTTKEGVNKLIDNKELSKNDKEKFRNKNIYDICNQIKDKCEIKFFFDENIWNKETESFAPSFKDVTDIYFEGINNEYIVERGDK